MDKFSYTPDEVFNDTSAYSDPQSESEVREQLSRPHKQVETYINNTLIPAINKGNTDIQSQIDNTLTPAIEARMKTTTYDADGNGIVDNAEKVNGHTVKSDVPENAKFTDTTYQQASETVTGLAKLYSGTGANTDGSMTQAAVTDAITKAAFGDIPVDTEMSDTSVNPVQNKTVKEYIDNQLSTSCPFPVGFGGFFQTDPNSIYAGTTWQQKKDVFLLASGDTYGAGSTGGEAQHTLTVDEMPKHRHASDSYQDGYSQNTVQTDKFITWVNKFIGNSRVNDPQTGEVGDVLTSQVGGSQPHNNLPPYFAMPFWIRTA